MPPAGGPATTRWTTPPFSRADFAPLLARVLLSLLFIYSGIGKLMGPEGTMAYIAKAGLPLPMLSYAMALVVELGVPT